jgi:maltose operon protein
MALRLIVVATALLTLTACTTLGIGSGGGSGAAEETVRSSWFDPLQANSPMYTAVSPSAAQSRTTLNAAVVCCDALSELRFEPLNVKNADFFRVDASAQAYAFNTGKSFLRAFVIPDNLDRAKVTIEAIAGATVFVPTVLILDRDYAVSRAIDADQFVYTPAGFMEPQRLKGSFYLDRRQGGELANEKYLVVFTTDDSLNGSTEMISEARLHARSRGLADPGLPNPVAEHAATGVFRLTVGDLETNAASTTQYVTERKAADRYVSGAGTGAAAAAVSKPVPPRAEPAPRPRTPAPSPAMPPRTPSGAQPMLAETQAMYDRMIRESVSSGDMDRAWRLVQEAERAGSTSARQAFLKAVEQK